MKPSSTFTNLKRILKKGDLHLLNILVPAFLSFLAATFDGLSKAFLIPLLKGLVDMDFRFAYKSTFLQNISIFPSNIFADSNIPVFLLLIALVFVTAIIHHALVYFASIEMAYRLIRWGNNLRCAIFNRFLGFGKMFFDKHSFGHLNSFLFVFPDFIGNNMMKMQTALTEFFRLMIYLTILFIISWKITIFVLLIVPTLYYLLKHVIKKIKTASAKLTVAKDELSKASFNILSNIALVKSYDRENQEQKSFSDLSNERKKIEIGIIKKINFIKPLQNIFMVTGFLFLIVVTVLVFAKEYADKIAPFLVYLYVLKGCTESFGVINTIRANAAQLAGPTEAILKIFDDLDKPYVISGRKKFMVLKKSIEFNRLNFSYGEGKNILKDVTFAIKKGELTALVGPTGGGKTTIISLLMRFYDCSPGTIMIDGIDIREFDVKSLRHHIAYVSQDTLLFNDTLRNNITYGMGRVEEGRLTDALKKARLSGFVETLPHKLDTLTGDKGIKLSGGERQRLSIARALLKGSEILVLDEATSSLDSITEKKIQDAIEDATKERTAIVIAHRLSTIRNANKIVVIEDGKVVEDGTLGELLSKKRKFYAYWEGQKFH